MPKGPEASDGFRVPGVLDAGVYAPSKASSSMILLLTTHHPSSRCRGLGHSVIKLGFI